MDGLTGYHEGVCLFRNQAAAPLQPCTNNGVEGTNRSIKDDYVGRHLEPMKSFLPKVAAMVKAWSERSESLSFAAVPDIPDALWNDGFRLSRNQWFKIFNMPSSGLRFVRDFSKGDPDIPVQQFVHIYCNPTTSLQSFSQYQKFLSSFHVVKATQFGYLTCSCAVGLKMYRCEHSIAVEIRQRMIEVPERLTSEPLGKVKKGPGRPRKVMGGFRKK